MPGRKRMNSNAFLTMPPMPKRGRALSTSGGPVVSAQPPTFLVDSDLESDEYVVAKGDDYIDEEGSFFFPPANFPPDVDPADNAGGCIKLVSVLPSELKDSVGEESAEEHVPHGDLAEANGNTEDKPAAKRVTRSSNKVGRPSNRATGTAPTTSSTPNQGAGKAKNAAPKATSKPKAQAKPKNPPKTKSQPAPKAPPKSNSNSKGKGKVKFQPEPALEVESDSEFESIPTEPVPKPKLKLKLKARSAPVQPKSESEDNARSDPEDSNIKQSRGAQKAKKGRSKAGKNVAEPRLEVDELAFAVEYNGAQDIISLPFTADFDVLRCQVAELLHVSPIDLKLAYAMPGMKKADRRHLRSSENFEALKTEARRTIQGYIEEIETEGKTKAQTALGKLEGYAVNICDLNQGKTGGGKQESSKTATSSTKDASSRFLLYQQHIKSRRCKTCGTSCAIINKPGQGPCHVPLPEGAIDLWATLAVQNHASAYTPNPPPRVLNLLNDASHQQTGPNKSGEDVGTKSGRKSSVTTKGGDSADCPSKRRITTSFGSPASQFSGTGSLMSPSGFQGLSGPAANGNSLLAANLANMSQGASLSPGLFSPFASQMAQPPVVLYGGPQQFPIGMGMGMGMGMAGPSSMFSGYGNPFTSVGGFPTMMPLGGMGIHMANDSDRFESESNQD